MTCQPDRRRLVLALLRAGQIGTGEAARACGVSRPCIWQWCRAAGFDPRAARRAYVAALLPSVLADVSDATERGARDETADAQAARAGPAGARGAPVTRAALRRRARSGDQAQHQAQHQAQPEPVPPPPIAPPPRVTRLPPGPRPKPAPVRVRRRARSRPS